MCRGLSKNQQKILQILDLEKNQHCFHKELGDGWINVSELLFKIKYGIDYYERDIREKQQDNLTEIEKQSYWRAIRLLEKKSLIKSIIKGTEKWKYRCEGTKNKFIKLINV